MGSETSMTAETFELILQLACVVGLVGVVIWSLN
jgi:hypothetical protein